MKPAVCEQCRVQEIFLDLRVLIFFFWIRGVLNSVKSKKGSLKTCSLFGIYYISFIFLGQCFIFIIISPDYLDFWFTHISVLRIYYITHLFFWVRFLLFWFDVAKIRKRGICKSLNALLEIFLSLLDLRKKKIKRIQHRSNQRHHFYNVYFVFTCIDNFGSRHVNDVTSPAEMMHGCIIVTYLTPFVSETNRHE